MAEVLLFHHALGLTPGVRTFAGDLRDAGHVVHVPDLFDGRTFEEIEDGVSHAREVGFHTILERGKAAAERLPEEIVYAGFSLGGMPAQMLAQTRARARGALLFHSCIPPAEFGNGWPTGLPLQIHMMDEDPFATEEGGDLEVAEQLAASTEGVELYLYSGTGHLFAETSHTDYDEQAAALMTERSLRFLDRVG